MDAIIVFGLVLLTLMNCAGGVFLLLIVYKNWKTRKMNFLKIKEQWKNNPIYRAIVALDLSITCGGITVIAIHILFNSLQKYFTLILVILSFCWLLITQLILVIITANRHIRETHR